MRNEEFRGASVDYRLSCSEAKPILLASFSWEGGGPFLYRIVAFDIFTTSDKLIYKIKFERNGGRYNSHSAKRNISNFCVTKIYRVQRTYRMRSIYRQSICSSHDKLDILLRNSINKSKDLFGIFC